ncbi:MAG: hypothetical protein EON60_09470 [Alphaproteobacteria bacterium]|nr:MAG: hypothetical protein EON60_09470 [Alphaproteobacteria bacterium]
MSDLPPRNDAPQPPSAPSEGPIMSEEAAVQKLREKLIERLPGSFQQNLPQYQSTAKDILRDASEFLGPLWAELRTVISSARNRLAQSTPSSTVGATFRHLCFVGLNKSELLLGGESQSITNDNWTDLTSDNIKRSTGLMFFAPRGLDGKPVNPYMFLAGEGVPDEEDMVDPNTVALAEQVVGPMALLDLCRISSSPPNTVNLLLVADCLFHWDTKDNYVLPTTPTSWVRDIEQVLKTYPRTTRANLYTQWDTDLLPPSERITVHRLREFPLDDNTWLNRPTLQERYGMHMLVIGIVLSAAVWAGLWYQSQQIQQLTDQLNVIEQQIPRGGQFSDMERGIAEQERMWQKRDLFGLVTKDAARSIHKSGIKISSFEVRVAEQDQPPKTYVVTIDAKADAYQGWLQQEPIARSLILQSAVLDAIRKPPTTTGFKLEGIVDANTLARDFRPYANRLKAAPSAAATSGTQPAAVSQEAN